MANNSATEKWQLKNGRQLRVAIVHDWLVGGGAEKVVEQLHYMFPDAPIYTSHATDEWRQKLNGKVITGWLQYWPFSRLRKFIPLLRIWWFTHLKFNDYDLVISSSGNGEAKSIHVPKGTVHVCYCHSPTHFYWRHYEQYFKEPGFGVFNPLARFGLRLLVSPLRRWDLKASKRPDFYIANSTHIQHDIKMYYGRDSVVINPPVAIERFYKLKQPRVRKGFVTIGRLKPYKHVDTIIEACNKLGLPLTVVGRGPELETLKKLAGSSITFDSHASDEKVAEYLSSAKAFLFAAYEDFGIAPVEAMAAGTPVIAYKAGGALDYVVEGKTGTFFSKQTPESLMKSLNNFKPEEYVANDIKRYAEKFSAEKFRKTLQTELTRILK